MLRRKRVRKFLISQNIFPVLIAVVALINGVNVVYSTLSGTPLNLRVTIGGIILIIILIYLSYKRWEIEQNLVLIKEYKSLISPLKNITARNKSTSAWQVVMDTLQYKTDLQPSWVSSFDDKGENVDKAFYKLNAELEKLISNPHRLWNNNTLYIGEQFKSIVVNNKEMYKMFIKTIDTDIIRKNWFNYEAMKKEYNGFYFILNHSRTKDGFEELKDLFGDEFFAPLPEPKNRTLIY